MAFVYFVVCGVPDNCVQLLMLRLRKIIHKLFVTQAREKIESSRGNEFLITQGNQAPAPICYQSGHNMTDFSYARQWKINLIECACACDKVQKIIYNIKFNNAQNHKSFIYQQ